MTDLKDDYYLLLLEYEYDCNVIKLNCVTYFVTTSFETILRTSALSSDWSLQVTLH